MNNRPTGSSPISNQVLGAYLGSLLASTAALQTYVALVDDHRITVSAGLLLAAVAAGIVAFLLRFGTPLRTRAYGYYLAHVAAYLIVNGGFWAHAGFLLITDQSDLLRNGWSGPLLSMSFFWGLGLLIHTVGAMLARGFEQVDVP